MSTSLSNEYLKMDDFPETRTYSVYPNEKYDLNHQYFPTENQAPITHTKDLEKELRLCYRAGHLDEIKRKQFGKIYSLTRKHYMNLELEAVRSMPKTKVKFVDVKASGIYDAGRYIKPGMDKANRK